MGDLLFRCQHVIRREVEVIRHQVSRNGVKLIGGEASFVDPHTLVIKGQEGTTEIGADHLVIATGTVPSQPEEVEVDQETVITSDMMMSIKRIPKTMTVVGAGVIGTEYASIFAALGVEVTLVDKQRQLLEFVDVEIMESLKYQMRDMDCIFRLGEEVASVTIEEPRRAVAILKSGKRIVSELLLYSIGRMGATPALNLEAAGLTADQRGRLKVDERYQTEQPHIFAAGDVIGFPALASTSMEQGGSRLVTPLEHP